MGDHTDYVGGLALPDGHRPRHHDRGPSGRRSGASHLGRGSTAASIAAIAAAGDRPDPEVPGWGRYVAAVVAEVGPTHGLRRPRHDDDPHRRRAVVERRARGGGGAGRSAIATRHRSSSPSPASEPSTRASGVPCGVMDQLTSICGVEGHALLVDFRALTYDVVALPASAEIVVIHSGQSRRAGGLGVRRPATRRWPTPSARSVRCATPTWTICPAIRDPRRPMPRPPRRHGERPRRRVRRRAGGGGPASGRLGHGRVPRQQPRRLRGVDPRRRRARRPAHGHARRLRGPARRRRIRWLRANAHRTGRSGRRMEGTGIRWGVVRPRLSRHPPTPTRISRPKEPRLDCHLAELSSLRRPGPAGLGLVPRLQLPP